MKQTRFYIEKELLKNQIVNQEKLLKYEVEKTINPNKIILKIIPKSIKKIFGLDDSSTNNPIPTIANFIIETQKIIGNIIQVVNLFKQLRTQISTKK